jgi:alpha-beta hydrolase superfamily lysophospholipase
MKKIIQITASDGTILNIRHWKPAKINETIIALHGLSDHSGWYEEFLDEFYLKGYEVYAMDRRGSGLNPSNRGDVEDYGVWINDVKELIDKEGLKKVSLAGVSFGALIALAFGVKYSSYVKDIILFAPAMKTKFKLGLPMEISIFFSILFNPRQMFYVPQPLNSIAAQKEDLKKILNDPLNQKYFTARFFKESIKIKKFVKKNYYLIKIPQIIFLGEDDHVINNEYAFKFFKGSKIVIYKGAEHTIFINNAKAVSEDIDGWLKQVDKK